jgi:SAM-dependent methyltransferase
MELDEYRAANLANWNDRVPIHWDSDGYKIRNYVDDPEYVSDVIQFDRDRDELGDVSGKTLLHLQCHIGTDTLGWARSGASVTGVDFSESAITAARKLSAESNTPGEFVVAELYDSPNALPGRQFDIVYTGVGALCWLPDIDGWAKVVAHFFLAGQDLLYPRSPPNDGGSFARARWRSDSA